MIRDQFIRIALIPNTIQLAGVTVTDEDPAYEIIRRAIESNKFTHAAAAKITKVGRTVITAIMNGNIEKISTDRLIDVAYALGLNVRLRVEREKKPVRHVKAVRSRSRMMAAR